MFIFKTIFYSLTLVLLSFPAWSANIIHDAEYYISEVQNSEKWATDDKLVDKKLAEFREKNIGITNLRPETKAAVEAFMFKQQLPMK